MKRWIADNRGFLVFLLCLGFFRTAVADWNPIPSSSMRPTLLEGDVVLVNRLAYDLKVPLTDLALLPIGEPRRGDVVTFHSPRDGTRLIKRIVALPGDTVALRDDRLLVNGVEARYDEPVVTSEPVVGAAMTALTTHERLPGSAHPVQFLPDRPALRHFGPVTVPRGAYFVLGDNRDNSADSRYLGAVPRQLLIGRAHHILASADITGNGLPRLARFGSRIP